MALTSRSLKNLMEILLMVAKVLNIWHETYKFSKYLTAIP